VWKALIRACIPSHAILMLAGGRLWVVWMRCTMMMANYRPPSSVRKESWISGWQGMTLNILRWKEHS
jgi:hypothetical protein